MSDWDNTCVVCARRGRIVRLDTGHVCLACALWVTTTLRQIGQLVDLAAVSVDRQRTGSGSSKPVFGSRPPLDVECLDPQCVLVRNRDIPPYPTLLEVVEEWERMIREDRDLAPYGPATVARGGATVHGCLSFLLAQADWMTTEPSFPIDDFADDLRACLRAVKRWDADNVGRAFSLPCPTLREDGTDCGYRLAFGDGADTVTCRRCQVTRDVETLVAVGMASSEREVWVDAEVVTLRYGIPKRTLQRMAQRGQVRRDHGRYLLSDIDATRTA